MHSVEGVHRWQSAEKRFVGEWPGLAAQVH